MKAKELRVIDELNFKNKMLDIKKELMKINSQISIGTIPKNPSKARELRKIIAKLLTIKEELKRNE